MAEEIGNCVQVCTCNFGMSNTGTECTPLFEVVKKLLLIPTYDSTGTRNFISLTGTPTINQALFTAMINQADTSKRLYPLPDLKDIKDNRGEPIRETFPDRSSSFIADGVRTFDGIIVGRDGNTILKGQLEAIRCGDLSVYAVDRTGSLIGIISSDGTQLFPIRLESNSFSAAFIKPTDTTVQKLQITFNYHPDENDNCLRIVTTNNLGDANLLSLKGLLDVFGIFSDITTTTATVKLVTRFGDPMDLVTVKGLVTADFVSADSDVASKLYNVTDDADITLTSATESITAPGTYDLVFTPAQTSADVMAAKILKAGFDSTPLSLTTFTIP